VPTVLIVEDERKLRDLLRSYLEREGFAVVTAGSGADGLRLASTAHPDLVVLDLGLPDVTGESVAVELRRSSPLPIVMLTAKAEESDRIAGLELGADDYITKPFSPRELVLRIRAVLRRVSAPSDDEATQSLGGGRLVIDHGRREVTLNGRAVGLTPTEWGILTALATAPGRVYSRAELINRARGHEFQGYERSVDSHIKNLRRKLEPDPANPSIVVTVLGGGYRLALSTDA
jgi:DNA-binding response OmpR family regulator